MTTSPNRTPEQLALFRLARDVLPDTVSHSKCWRFVDFYTKTRLASTDEYKRISYQDRTGERATFRAFIASLNTTR